MTKFKCGTNENCCINLRDWGLLLLRLVVGAFMLTHGIPKLMNFSMLSESFPAMLGLSPKMGLILIIFAEVFASIALIFGLLTRLATIPLIIGMAVAAFAGHAGAPFNVMEIPLLYMSIYIVLLLTGPGKYALDTFIYKKCCPRGKKSEEQVEK
ncbi:MAG: DoxX family protein [Paludibacteraceae bacterium]